MLAVDPGAVERVAYLESADLEPILCSCLPRGRWTGVSVLPSHL
jgi:hypothetical protein